MNKKTLFIGAAVSGVLIVGVAIGIIVSDGFGPPNPADMTYEENLEALGKAADAAYKEIQDLNPQDEDLEIAKPSVVDRLSEPDVQIDGDPMFPPTSE